MIISNKNRGFMVVSPYTKGFLEHEDNMSVNHPCTISRHHCYKPTLSSTGVCEGLSQCTEAGRWHHHSIETFVFQPGRLGGGTMNV